MVEGPMPPDLGQGPPRPCRFFTSRAPSEVSQEYRHRLEKDAEFVLNNHDFSELTAEETIHLRELRQKLSNSFRFAQSNQSRVLRIIRGHRGGGSGDEPSDDDGGPPPPPPPMNHRSPQAPSFPDDNPPRGSHRPASRIPSGFVELILNSYRNTPTRQRTRKP